MCIHTHVGSIKFLQQEDMFLWIDFIFLIEQSNNSIWTRDRGEFNAIDPVALRKAILISGFVRRIIKIKERNKRGSKIRNQGDHYFPLLFSCFHTILKGIMGTLKLPLVVWMKQQLNDHFRTQNCKIAKESHR